ncbi:microtubule assembly factor abnormal spindle [Arctopsyche grandis]|uniref:microtubule assembly factor abnormal spindle n=1 Tax=Arctopsyche grandis TaxID=121162 RepID=UPI00406D9AC2
MYFEIDNTPENVKRKRVTNPKEEHAILKLVPFSPAPIITFENVPVDTQAVRIIHVSNPKSDSAKVFVSKRPDELGLKLSWYENCIPPNQVVPLEISWTPQKALSQRFTLQFCDSSRGRYDALIVCKSIVKKGSVLEKGKGRVVKNVTKKIGVIKSPVQIKSKCKSPKSKSNYLLGAIKKSEIDLKKFNGKFENENETLFSTTVTIENKFQTSSFMESEIDFNLRRETYLIPNKQIFANNDFEKENDFFCQQTPMVHKKNEDYVNNGQSPRMFLSAIENMTYTPLKTHNSNIKKNKPESISYNSGKHDHHPNDHKFNIDLSISEMAELSFEFPSPNSLFKVVNKPSHTFYPGNDTTILTTPNLHVNVNATHSIIDLRDCSGSFKVEPMDLSNNKKPTIFVTDLRNRITNFETNEICQTPNENHSPLFNPKRCSTEIKNLKNLFASDEVYETFVCDASLNSSIKRLSSETYIKGDSPIIPLNPDNNEHKHSSPYTMESPPTHNIHCSRTLFSDNLRNQSDRMFTRNTIRDRNDSSIAKSIIEANLWTKSPSPTCTPLTSIPEEPSTILSETGSFNISKRIPFETFILDRTYEKGTNQPQPRAKWNKTSANRDLIIQKIDHTFKLPKVISETQSKKKNIRIMEKSSHTLDVYTIATTVDPFLATTCLYDEEAFDRLESEFKRWLNYLLTPPSDLDTKLDIDIGKAWIENRNKAVPAAPTKEQVSSKYHTSHRLESLRRSAKTLIKSTHITQVFLKITSQIERKLLSIRSDKNLHLDIGLQKIIVRLLMCYNPLWLRIGLEALYDKTIPLSSNDDVCGLSDFIVDHVFRDPYVSSKHILIQPSYAESIKKFTLKKFLFLVYFLDQAKQQKLIFHDPCLFCRNAPFKESRQILIQFTKELLSGVGDITKHLRPTGYVVSHKQSYLNEFKYGVRNLAVDLKDGIRLTRLMELILMKENLISGLRTPAISRLQKIHNVQIALTALESADFKIVGDITSRDIADGHREKTLSLLWQLIHRFRAPLFENAAIIMQKWWRRKYFKISIENRIKNRHIRKLNDAAVAVQSWWRGIYYRKQVLIKRSVETRACLVIQKAWRMFKCKSTFIRMQKSAVTIQRFYRNHMLNKEAKIQLIYLRRVKSAIVIQSWFKKIQLHRSLKAQNSEREQFLRLKSTVIKIQNIFRANLLAKRDRKIYITLKTSTVKIQRYYRTLIKTRIVRQQYLELKSATCLIQDRFRANMTMRICREAYASKRNAAVTLQRYYRNYIITKKHREDFLRMRATVVYLQERYRSKVMMKRMQNAYSEQKRSAVLIQRCYRSYHQMRIVRSVYLSQRSAAVKIQRWFRSYRVMQKEKSQFLSLKRAAVTIQRLFRSNVLMKEQRLAFSKLKNACLCVQRRYRARQQTKLQRQRFLEIKKATITLQQKYRAYILMKLYRGQYLELKRSVVTIQTIYRNNMVCKNARLQFLTLKSAAEVIQRKYRANKIKQIFSNQRLSAILIQRYYRNYRQMKLVRMSYLQQKTAATVIQKYYRAYLEMKSNRISYHRQKDAAIAIQKYYRNYRAMKSVRMLYLQQRTAATVIQRYYRTYREMKLVQTSYLQQKSAAIAIQKYYRNYLEMKSVRMWYLHQRTAATVIQKYYRAYLEMKSNQISYHRQKAAAIAIQKYYRNYLEMKSVRMWYLHQRTAATVIQKYYRTYREMKLVQTSYLQQKTATIIIQKYYRNYIEMKSVRMLYLHRRTAATVIQKYYRAHLEMKSNQISYHRQKAAAIAIQKYYRNYLEMKSVRMWYLHQRTAATVIQKYYRTYREMKLVQTSYLQQKTATIIIQKYYRNYIEMKSVRMLYLHRRTAATVIQKYYRAHLEMKSNQISYHRQKAAAIAIQKYYRNYLEMKSVRMWYLHQRTAATVIQKYYRTYREMKLVQTSYLQQKTATIIIQKYYRNYIEMKSVRMLYLHKRTAATVIQRYHRANHKMKLVRMAYLQQKTAATVIQKYYRNYLQMKSVRMLYLHQRTAATVIQKYYRTNREMKLVRMLYLRQKAAAMVIQKYYRTYCEMKLERMSYLQQKTAAIVIQKYYRTYCEMKLDRMSYLQQKTAAIVIQKYYRVYCEMKSVQMSYLQQKAAAMVIQKYYRAFCEMQSVRILYLQRKTSALIIQKYYRKYLIVKRERHTACIQRYYRTYKAAVTIQTFYRSWLEMKRVQNRYKKILASASIIQNYYRSYLETKKARERFVQLKHSTIIIQRHFRNYKAAQTQRSEYLKLMSTVRFIQMTFRSKSAATKCRTDYLNQKRCASIIQNYYRSYKTMKHEREQYLYLVKQVSAIQRRYRSKLRLKAAVELERQTAATTIQSYFRMYICRKNYISLRSATIVIQRGYRRYVTAKMTRIQYLHVKTCIVTIQTVIRRWLMRRRSERYYESKMVSRCRNWKEFTTAVIRIQAYWRGYNLRKKQGDDSRIKKLRRRWQEGALVSNQPTLAERNDDALDVLGHFKDIASVIRAFKTLDFGTSVCPMKYVGEAEFIARRLILYMGATNRSVSTLETLQPALYILINLTRYTPTAHSVYKTEYLNTLLNLLMRWCDKDNVLSRSLCTLIWLFGQYEDIKKDLTVFLQKEESHKILCKVRCAMVRRKKMESRKRNSHIVNHTPIKGGHTPMKNGTSFRSLSLPMTEPDYGISRSSRPKIFEDDVYAIDTVFLKYNLTATPEEK